MPGWTRTLPLSLAIATACGDRLPRNEHTPSLGRDGSHSVSLGPVLIPPGAERTLCVVKRLDNPTPLRLGAVHDVLGPAHHAIVYRVSDSTERVDPFDCRPFTDTLDPSRGAPLVISQRRDDRLVLPDGVAFTLDPHQMIRLEVHVINAGPHALTFTASSTMEPIPEERYRSEAGILFVGDIDVAVAPRGTTTLGPTFIPLPSEFAASSFFAITGHTHRLGTNVLVWSARSREDLGTAVYDVPGWRWSEPRTVVGDPPFSIPSGGGFALRCDWSNGSDTPVGFGESANDEMCFFWAYYFPSVGSRACLHSDRLPGGPDACCPGPSELCKLATDQAPNR